jgi:hypothetical protein
MKLVTLRLDAQRGTVAAGETFVEQIPEAWITADGADVPSEGDVVRVVDGRLAVDAPPRVIRVDRTSTSVWTVGAEN